MMGDNSRRKGTANRERVRLFFEVRPGARQIACARALGLSANAVNVHVKALAKAAGVKPRAYPSSLLKDSR